MFPTRLYREKLQGNCDILRGAIKRREMWKCNPDTHHILACNKLDIFVDRHNNGVIKFSQALRWAGFQIHAVEPLLGNYVPDAGQKRLDIIAKRGMQQFGIDFTFISTDLAAAEQAKRIKCHVECGSMRLPFYPVAISITGAAGPDTINLLDWLVDQLLVINNTDSHQLETNERKPWVVVLIE